MFLPALFLSIVPISGGLLDCICFKGSIPKAKVAVQNMTDLNLPSDVEKVFEISRESVCRHQESVVEFIALGTAHDILQRVDFVSSYLPLQASSHRHEVQRIVEYFSAFQLGVRRCDIRTAIRQYDSIRPAVLNLWGIVTAKMDDDAPERVLGQHRPISDGHKRRIKIAQRSSRSRSVASSDSRTLQIWEKDWRFHNGNASKFRGLGPKDTEFVITVELKVIVIAMDMLYELLTGKAYPLSSMHTNPLSVQKAHRLLINEFFQNSAFDNIEVDMRSMVVSRFIFKTSAQRRKLNLFMMNTFVFAMLKSADLAIRPEERSRRHRACIYAKPFSHQQRVFVRIEARFDIDVISSLYFDLLTANVRYLVEGGGLSHGEYTFSDLVRRPGDLMLLYVLLSVANVDGHCRLNNRPGGGYAQAIFCVWCSEQELLFKGNFLNSTHRRPSHNASDAPTLLFEHVLDNPRRFHDLHVILNEELFSDQELL